MRLGTEIQIIALLGVTRFAAKDVNSARVKQCTFVANAKFICTSNARVTITPTIKAERPDLDLKKNIHFVIS